MTSKISVSSMIQVLGDKKAGNCLFQDIETQTKDESTKKLNRLLYLQNVVRNAEKKSTANRQRPDEFVEWKISSPKKVCFILSPETDMNSNTENGKLSSYKLTGIIKSEDKKRQILPTIESAIGQLSQLKPTKPSGKSRKINISIPNPDSYTPDQGSEDTEDVVRIRYTHGMSEESLRLSQERFHMMTVLNHELEMDSVDIVFDANKPETAKSTDTLPSNNVCSNESLKMSSQKTQQTKSVGEIIDNITCNTAKPESVERLVIKVPSVDSRIDTSVEISSTDTENVLHDEIKPIKEVHNPQLPAKDYTDEASYEDFSNKDDKKCCRKKKTKNRLSKKKQHKDEPIKTISVGHVGYINPEIHREAYIRALQDARYKYFRRSHPGLSVTEPYKFSYFDVTNESEKRGDGTRRDRDFRNYVGMRRIFGDIRLDDYYSPKRGK